MLVWAAILLVGTSPSAKVPEEADRTLASFFYGARGGFLLHPLSHYVCDDPDRLRQNREIAEEYARLERRYLKLGGKFAPDSEQPILLETHHFSCPQGRERLQSVELWEVAANGIEDEMAAVRRLLAQKEKALRQANGPSE